MAEIEEKPKGKEVNQEDTVWERIEFAQSYFAKGYLMALLDYKLICMSEWGRLMDRKENEDEQRNLNK